ncbi:hypothetical protein BSKO_12256 [Bryopsis sp. KO-2023]|nr:hypothetical protein BSKO_12256 [Bryopsis sp. KO-2023]
MNKLDGKLLRTAGLWLLLLGADLPRGSSQRCRMDPDASHSHCGLPNELSNFQGHYECDNDVKVGKPEDISQLRKIVRKFDKVNAVGVGHSWWKEQFCSGSDENSVNIVMTELKNVQPIFSTNNLWGLAERPDFPIQVNEEEATVTVAAGVSQRQVLDFLADYRYGLNPEGWTLPAFSWFIDQTIGGAVATGSHGSSLRHGSLSQAVVKMNVVLADGSLKTITRQSDPHLFRAFLVSVGRLGIITELTLKILPQVLVERTNTGMGFDRFVDDMRVIQDAYRSARASGDRMGMFMALSPVDETQLLWHVPAKEVWRVDFDRLDDEMLETYEPLVSSFSGPPHARGVEDQREKGSVGRSVGSALLNRGTNFWSNRFRDTLRGNAGNGVYQSRKAYLTMSEEQTRWHSGFTGYDQYEVSVPIDIFADCLEMMGDEIYGRDALWDGFRTPVLVRFVSEEDAYLSNTNGGPRVYFNMEDYVSYNTKVVNARFQRTIELLRTRCNARLHWGKAGWPRHAQCFDGAREYPDSWCDFGCAVHQVDPNGKFSKESDVWNWRAVDNQGNDVKLGSCCSENGFDKEKCRCVSRKKC